MLHLLCCLVLFLRASIFFLLSAHHTLVFCMFGRYRTIVTKGQKRMLGPTGVSRPYNQSPNSYVMAFEMRSSGEIGLVWLWRWSSHDDLAFLQEHQRAISLSGFCPSPHLCHVRHHKKVAVCKPGSKLLTYTPALLAYWSWLPAHNSGEYFLLRQIPSMVVSTVTAEQITQVILLSHLLY